MALIDDRGRVFGKINLIDAIVIALVLGLIPVAYAAYRLFRVPIPAVSTVTPSQVTEGHAATLQITGADLRPFLRATFGIYSSPGFLVQSPTQAEIKVPATLPAGAYDLILYDEGQELVRVPGAVTVAPLVVQGPVRAIVTARVRFAAHPEVAGLVRIGDADVGLTAAAAQAPGDPVEPTAQATLVAIDPDRRQVSARGIFDSISGRRFELDQPMVVFTATVRVPVTETRVGWWYKEKAVKLGMPFVFETTNGVMDGSILSMRIDIEEGVKTPAP